MSAVNGKEESYYKDGGPTGIDHMHPNESPENALNRIRTAGSVSIPPELFEKLYLSPESKVKGELRRTFGNPTPIGLGGFLLSLSPLSCFLMNWRNTLTGYGSSDIAAYLFFGGILMLVSGAMEWLLGNTFTAVVFMTFGSFWLTYGGTLQPFYMAYGNYSPDPSNPALGMKNPVFPTSFAFFLLFMGLLCLIYLICSLRTNAIFFMILLPLPGAFGCLSASFWYLGKREMAYAQTLQLAGGALAFITCMFGWYLFFALMLAAVDFPISLPVFDLSTKIKGGSQRATSALESEPAQA